VRVVRKPQTTRLNTDDTQTPHPTSGSPYPEPKMPISILPRPSILTSLVVATAVASGLALGTLAAASVLLAARIKAR